MWLNRFNWFLVFSTFCLIIAGGLVTSTDSGLAVPDWPKSYGMWMPPMVGGVFYEHGHRMVASFVGFLTVIFAIWLAIKENRKWVKVLGFVALG
ncbi:MAG TPA: COX15/CtaA family protein, partial [Acidobacteriota bacterium]|nr:COX15/CtaA family protein [Acidobacteriota bacterium]